MNRPPTQPPVLDDERVALMRSGVMGAVDTDVRRRARRARLVSVGAGIGAVVLVIGTGLQLVGTGSVDVSGIPAGGSSVERGDSGGVAGPSDLTEEAPAVEPGQAPVPEAEAVDPDRAVITTGSASVIVDDPAGAALELATWAEAEGGRVDQRTDRDQVSTLTVRVPAGSVTAALEKLAELGEVESSTVQEVDVTTEVVDLDARIEALEASVARLTELITAAGTTSEVIEAETQLTYRQSELQGLRAQRDALGDQVELSTLDVTFSADPETPSVEPGGFLGGLQTGWEALVRTVNGLVEGLGVLVPWLGIAALLALVVTATRRVIRRRR